MQDTGEIQGISEAAESISYEAMAERQQVLAAAILKDRDVQSLSSFIGVDGANTTLNSGRFLINLKPHGARHATASEIIRRLKQETAGVVGITLYMQPLQDITIDSAVSRTQYQFVVESTDNNDFATWIPPLMQKLTELPDLADVASDMEQQGTATDLIIDRSTAARFGITPATVDNVLYDSYGQRIVSTIYTQSNQYRVILEADPSIQRSLAGLSELYLPSSVSSTNGQVPLSAIVRVNQRAGPLQITHLGQFPATTISFNLAPGSSLGAAVDAIRKAEQDIRLPAKFVTAFQGTAAAFQHVLTNQAAPASGVRRHHVHRARRPLREFHPSDHHSLDAPFGRHRRHAGSDHRRRRSGRARNHRHHPADRHRQEKRHHDDRFRPGRAAQGGARAARGDHPGLAPEVPADSHDHDGGSARRIAADAELRRGIGAPAPVGHRDRGRIDHEPAAHPVHDAGHLPGLRPRRGAPAPPSGGRGSGPV